MSLAEGEAFPPMVRRRYAARYFILNAMRKSCQLTISKVILVRKTTLRSSQREGDLTFICFVKEQVYQSI